MRKLLGLWGLVVLLLAMAGCATVPMAPADLDAGAKRFEPPPLGMAALYVARRALPIGVGSPVPITIGPNQVGSMLGATYFRFDLAPGRYEIRHQSEDNSSSVTVDLAAGETTFVELAWRIGSFYRMQVVPAPVGREIVAAGQRAQQIR